MFVDMEKLKQTRWTAEQLARIKLAAKYYGTTSDALIRAGTMEKVQEIERKIRKESA